MTNVQAVAVILRAAGLWLFVDSLLVAIVTVPLALFAYVSIAVAAISIFFLLLGAWLALRPLGVARMLLPNTSSEVTTTIWSVDEFQAAMFSVLGMYFLVLTITDLYGWVHLWANISDIARKGMANQYQDVTHIGSMFLRLVAGIWLLLGAKGLRGIIIKIRSLGSSPLD